MWLPVERSWRLNERHYGALQGLDKAQTVARHGAEQVKIWRRSYDIPPPPLAADDPQHPRFERRYASVPVDELPAAESLEGHARARAARTGRRASRPELQRRRATCLVAAHGNSLRALVQDARRRCPSRDIVELNIPTGVPLLYELDVRAQAARQPLSRRRGRRSRRAPTPSRARRKPGR